MSGGRERRGEETAEVGTQGAEEDEALGLPVSAAVMAVVFASTGGLAEAEPASGAVAGAEEAVGVDEAFEGKRSVCVAGVPVGREAAGGQAQEAGGEEADLDPG